MKQPRAKAVSGPSRTAALRQQMEELQAELKRVEQDEEASFGRLARKAGVFDLGVTDKDMREALEKLVASFRPDEPQAASEG